MRLQLSLLLSLSGLVLAAGCASGAHSSSDEVERLDQVVRDTGLEGLQIETELEELGIKPVQGVAGISSEGAVLGVDQIGDVAATRPDYAFERIEGNHPCLRDDAVGEACRAESGQVEEWLAAMRQRSRLSTETELQAFTSNVIDPDTFDPARTADEIGRSGALRSQAAQAVGSMFLEGTPAPVPEEPETPEENGLELPEGATGFIDSLQRGGS